MLMIPVVWVSSSRYGVDEYDDGIRLLSFSFSFSGLKAPPLAPLVDRTPFRDPSTFT